MHTARARAGVRHQAARATSGDAARAADLGHCGCDDGSRARGRVSNTRRGGPAAGGSRRAEDLGSRLRVGIESAPRPALRDAAASGRCAARRIDRLLIARLAAEGRRDRARASRAGGASRRPLRRAAAGECRTDPAGTARLRAADPHPRSAGTPRRELHRRPLRRGSAARGPRVGGRDADPRARLAARRARTADRGGLGVRRRRPRRAARARDGAGHRLRILRRTAARRQRRSRRSHRRRAGPTSGT